MSIPSIPFSTGEHGEGAFINHGEALTSVFAITAFQPGSCPHPDLPYANARILFVRRAAIRPWFLNAPRIFEFTVKPFDELARRSAIENIDLIKVDAEGFYFKVLRGMEQAFGRDTPDVLISPM